MKGDEISVTILGSSMVFRVGKTTPNTIIRIEEGTVLTISDKTAMDGRTRITYEEVGGLTQEMKAMREIVELPLRHPELFARLGVEAHSGVLLYGPPGCGKTLIAKVLASESDANMYSISGPGDSQQVLRRDRGPPAGDIPRGQGERPQHNLHRRDRRHSPKA